MLTSTRVLVSTLLASLVALAIVWFGVRLNPDVVALIPESGESAALARYLRGFGGGGVGVVLIESSDPLTTRRVADAVALELSAQGSVAFATAKLEAPDKPAPLLAWRSADQRGRQKLAEALTPEGMRERLVYTRKLLLAPGSGAASERIAADPLRLSELAFEERSVGAGVKPRSDGYFATEDGAAHLVVFKPKGQALRGADAKALVHDVSLVLARHQQDGVTLRVAGPHAVASQMESMLRRDLTLSGAVATVLASLLFALLFGRVRALLAILPALLLGTLWSSAVAAAWPGGISAIAVAFTSIVVGVGFDTGIHVYAALLDARRSGLSPQEAARAARARTARPVLSAAAIAAAAFASLSLSSVEALAQLGVLCAAGEIATALAIVLITPELGALLERGAPPPERTPRFVPWLFALTETRGRAVIGLGVAIACGLSFVVAGVHVSDSVVAVRPSKLEVLKVEDRVLELFGGRVQPWIVLVADPDKDRAMARADRLAEALAADVAHIERVDALTSIVPAKETQRARLAERDALGLGKRADELEKALEEQGFRTGPFADFLAAMRAAPSELLDPDAAMAGDARVVASRYVAAEDAATLVAMHVHLTPEASSKAALFELVKTVDEGASVTGYARLESDLRAALRHDLPRIAGVALGLVLLLLAFALRNARDVLLSVAVLGVGLGALLTLLSLLGVPLHIYSALVIPVLLGVSVDEVMFLLHHSHGAPPGRDAVLVTLEKEARPVVTTALTTSAGLVALMFAQYDGLRDLGAVGAAGNLVNLLVALLVVPAGLRLLRSSTSGGTSGR